jgi:hypothetical protein
MCYGKPRPRCSYHTGIELAKANELGIQSVIDEAQEAYDKTATGTKELVAQAKQLETEGKTQAARSLKAKADRYMKEHKAQLKEYAVQQCAVAANPDTETPVLTKMMESKSEPTAARILAAKALIVRDNLAISGKTLEEVLGMFNIPKTARGANQ